jgi:hypothetical protein
MREAQQHIYAISDVYLAEVERAVAHVIASPDFRDYRVGPLMQLFAEMLHTARSASYQAHSTESLAQQLSPTGRLWRSYALKSRRFRHAAQRAMPRDADNASPSTLH